jgi:uncharacterized membrane protein
MTNADEPYLGSPDNPKTAAIVSYITLIGWFIAYFGLYKSRPIPFATFHLRQTLMLHCWSIAVNIFTMVVLWQGWSRWAAIVPAGVLTILWFWGLLDAVKEGQHPIPLLGAWAQRQFQWIRP